MIHEDTGNRKEEEPPTGVSPDNTCRPPEIRERGLKADNGGLSESHSRKPRWRAFLLPWSRSTPHLKRVKRKGATESWRLKKQDLRKE